VENISKKCKKPKIKENKMEIIFVNWLNKSPLGNIMRAVDVM